MWRVYCRRHQERQQKLCNMCVGALLGELIIYMKGLHLVWTRFIQLPLYLSETNYFFISKIICKVIKCLLKVLVFGRTQHMGCKSNIISIKTRFAFYLKHIEDISDFPVYHLYLWYIELYVLSLKWVKKLIDFSLTVLRFGGFVQR